MKVYSITIPVCVERDTIIDELTLDNERLKFLLAESRVDVGRNEGFIQKDQRTINIKELRSTIAGRDMAIAGLKADINRMKSTYESMYSSMVDANQAIMMDLKVSQANNHALSKRLEIANTTLYNAKNVVEGLEDKLSALQGTTPIDDDHNLVKLQSKATEVDRLRRSLTITDRELGELTELYCARCDQLEKIEKLIDTQSHRPKYVLLSRIKDIIWEK